MKLKRRVDDLRKKALALVREQRALTFVISPPDAARRARVRGIETRLARAGKAALLDYIARAEQHVRECRRRFGVRVSSENLLLFLEGAESAAGGNVTYLPLYQLRAWFRDYSTIWPDSVFLPAHTRVMFDAHGLGQGGAP